MEWNIPISFFDVNFTHNLGRSALYETLNTGKYAKIGCLFCKNKNSI